MKHTCKYHPVESASWYCSEDGIHFCDECVSSNDAGEGVRARCFLCNKLLQQERGGQSAKAPFWLSLSHFIRYPINQELMLVVGACALLTAVLPADWIGVGIAAALGLPLGVLGMGIFEHTAAGKMRAPGYKVLSNNELYSAGAQQWLIFAAALVALGFCFLTLGMIKGAGIALLAWLLLPALLIQTALDGSLATILVAPQRFLSSAFTIGLDYFLAAILLFAAFIGVSLAGSIVYDLLPSFISLPIAAMAAGWFYVMLSHLLGYLVSQHREQLDYTPSSLAGEESKRLRRAKRPEEERKLAAWLREGRFDKVVSLYRLKLEKQSGSLALNDQYERVLSTLGRRDEMLEHGTLYLEMLLANEQEYRVVEMVKRYRELDPNFRPASAATTWSVAQLLVDNGQTKVALNLLMDLHKRAPTWPGLAEAYLFVARLLKTEFKHAAKAEQYVRFVETRFRDPKTQALALAFREENDMVKA
jgi:tetratricopeptide (TPR) repeat protein